MNAKRTAPPSEPAEPDERVFREILGYLNFSGGKPDAAFLRNWNRLFAKTGSGTGEKSVFELLKRHLADLSRSVPAFADCTQASAVLEIVFHQALPAYRRHHADLLFNLHDADLEQPYFLARVVEAVLQQGAPWEETERIVRGAIDRLNDFVGYRPVAVLENGRQMEPYPHERFRPVPVYIRDAGVAYGPYHDLIERTIEFFRDTPPEILAESHFDLAQMEELAVDVRPHDHAHPVTKRTNYTFGEWDPHQIDTKGRYTRFVVRKIVLDALLGWMAEQKRLDPKERLYDAAAVLCGTMLMASAISGGGPDTHDSSVGLISLLPKVARQRDAFYQRLMDQARGARRTRLRREAKLTQQPFGHIRQHLNIALAQHGARQVQDRHVSRLYAQLGYPDEARAQSLLVPATSTRFLTEIEWRMLSAHRNVEASRVAEAARLLDEAEDFLDRGISCGALADPWNVLGFHGMFPLFSSREDVVPDPRILELIETVETLFGVYSLALAEAAALADTETQNRLTSAFERRAAWWDRFATSTVADLPKVSGRESWESAVRVSTSLAAWRQAGEGSGDISFWRNHVERFESAKAYSLVVEVLLRRRDFVAAMGLLIQWLSNSESVGLISEGYSLHVFLLRWMQGVLSTADGGDGTACWQAVRRLFDFLEANAGTFWSVPMLAEAQGNALPAGTESSADLEHEGALEEDQPPEEESLFEAAYEGVIYRDSTRDGKEGDTLETGPTAETAEVDALTQYLDPRLQFLSTLAQLWTMAGLHFASNDGGGSKEELSTPAGQERAQVIFGWRRKARSLARELSKLAEQLSDYELTLPSGEHDENVEYDYQRHAQLYLLHSAVLTQVRLRMADRLLSASVPQEQNLGEQSEAERRIVQVFRAALRRDVGQVRRLLPALRKQLSGRSLLYVALDSGGKPGPVRQVKLLQATLHLLLSQLPRIGCLRETWQLLRTAYEMERSSRPSGMVVSEFEQLFRTALKSTLECIVRSSVHWKLAPVDGGASRFSFRRSRRDGGNGEAHPPLGDARTANRRRPWRRQPGIRRGTTGKASRSAVWSATALHSTGTARAAERATWRNDQIVAMASDVVQRYLKLWLTHSRSMRLSSVEELSESSVWKHVRRFVETYGGDLFHAKMLTLGNVRSILDSGVESFLDYLDDSQDPLHPVKLLDDLYSGVIDSERAMTYLGMIYETIVDKFDRYVEYNTTTTQSDYGEKFYCLLDFLRAESAYERDAWNLSPIGLCHELFSECGRHAAAQVWELDFRARSAAVANKHLTRLRSLEKKYGMRLPSISDRLAEQFVKPLAINRMRALLPRALQESRRGHAPSPAFSALRKEIDQYRNTTNGSGIDVPGWLRILEREIDSLLEQSAAAFDGVEMRRLQPSATLTWNRLQVELKKWD